MATEQALSILNDDGSQTLAVLDIDGLDVAVQFLLGAFFVVAFARDADAEAGGNFLDASGPDGLVQLGVETDVGGSLYVHG